MAHLPRLVSIRKVDGRMVKVKSQTQNLR